MALLTGMKAAAQWLIGIWYRRCLHSRTSRLIGFIEARHIDSTDRSMALNERSRWRSAPSPQNDKNRSSTAQWIDILDDVMSCGEDVGRRQQSAY